MENNNNDKVFNFIKKEVSKLHKKAMLESELKKINSKLSILKEEENKEAAPYSKNVYEGYEKNLEDVVSKLAEASNLIESCIAKQRAHEKALPGLQERIDESKRVLETLMEMYKEVKSAKLKAESRMYEK